MVRLDSSSANVGRAAGLAVFCGCVLLGVVFEVGTLSHVPPFRLVGRSCFAKSWRTTLPNEVDLNNENVSLAIVGKGRKFDKEH